MMKVFSDLASPSTSFCQAAILAGSPSVFQYFSR
jgi:hypothetical protein